MMLRFLKNLRWSGYKLSLVNWPWFLQLKLKNLASGRIRVGFGPIVTGERTLSNRKWHIDPIVNYINKHSEGYVCDIFFYGDDLSRFDIIVSVKNFDNINPELINRLKKNNKIFIYDICDNPLGCQKSYLKETWYIESLDGIIMNNPLQREDVKHLNPNFRLINLPIINKKHKRNYKKKEQVKILWEGYVENIEFTKSKLNPIIEGLAKESPNKIIMVYHSNVQSKNEGAIKYVEWKLSNWEKVLIDSDIAVAGKPSDNEIQKRKPSTKVNTYRAAGLPVVCAPSEADRLIVEHGKTGYFASTDEQWYMYLKKLIESPKLREEIGTAGRRYVLENFDVGKIAQKYIIFFDELIAKKTKI